ncbi:MAG: DUF3806 domain-containing protein [Fimbriiglobus sp.]
MADQTFSLLSEHEWAWIAQQLDGVRLFVAAMSPADADAPVTLDALDRAWAAWLPQADDEQANAAINAVGTQFGQFLVDQAGFEWTIATDAHGTDLAILALPGRGNVLVYPANFVAKRWERREANFLAASFDAIQEQVVAVGQPSASRPWWRFW